MEKISGACALDWSIELEKGLRSTQPGRAMESINRIGGRLNEWSMEPQLSIGMCNMFGLVLGEDRVFADAILFRLADAFVSGDISIRKCIVKVFLSIYKQTKGEEAQNYGIFSNMSTENRLELLRRVGSVVHVECAKSRALVLLLFGCWSQIAKDVAEIRDAVLSSLTTCHVFEVKAALFAAGCFSECSIDFGYVVLQRLVLLLRSQKTVPVLKVAVARSFANLGCSLSLAMKSYKAGVELVEKFQEEDIIAPMLISLTKLSLKAILLISEQEGLLCSFLSQTTSSNVQATILRCIRLIGERAACFLSSGAFPVQSLFKMLDEPNTDLALRCDVFQIFLKIIAYGLPDLLFKHNDEFMKLLRYVENAARSPFLSERLLAFENFVCISTNLKGITDTSKVDFVNFPSRVAAIVIDQITVLASRLSGGKPSPEVGEELARMLHMLLVLVGDHSELGFFIMDKLHLVIENFVNSHNLPTPEIQHSDIHKVVEAGANQAMCPMQVLMSHIYNFLVAFLEVLRETGGTTEQVVWKLKHLISLVCGCSVFNCSIHTFYAIIWHSHVNRSCLASKNKKSHAFVEDLSKSPTNLLKCEAVIHMCTNNMLAGGHNWHAYKAGRYAACEGLWDVANYIFHHLETRVQSDLFCQWLKFLVQLSDSEKSVHMLLHQKPFCFASDHTLKSSGLDNADSRTISSRYIEQLVNACNDISCSDKMLEAVSVQKQTFYFQRWFLALRRKVILLLVDTLKILHEFLFCNVSISGNRHLRKGDVTCLDSLLPQVKHILSTLNGVSSRMASLVEEIDLLTSSFIGMDSRSSKIMSDLALGCSLLAFCTSLSNSITFRNLTKSSGKSFTATIKTLVGRLWPMDLEICLSLLSLLKDSGVLERSLHMLPKLYLSKTGPTSNDFLTVCRCSVKRIIDLQYQSLGVQNEDSVPQAYEESMQSLLNVVEAWMHIAVQVPKYFFRVRCVMGSLLFWSSACVNEQKELFVSPGCHLALNLCIQLKDMPADICSRFSRVYCILYCQTTFSVARPRGQSYAETQTSYQPSETDNMIHLNKKLQGYIMKQTAEFMNYGDHSSAGEAAEAYVCFKTNGRAQGFSTCLLDVSSFPVGSYEIYWHSGGVDSQGAYWSFLPLSLGPQFTVR